jgi:hypothetical protein
VGKGAGFIFNVKRKVCADADQIPAALQQNIFKYFYTLEDQHFRRGCTADILSEQNIHKNQASAKMTG